MLSAITAGLKAVLALFDIITGAQRRRERQEYREAGRNEQKVADLTAREGQASHANRIDEDVRRMSDDALDRELRGPSDSRS